MIIDAAVRMSRVSSLEDGTFSALTLNGIPFCVTLEPRYHDNDRNISCIPPDMYIMEKVFSDKYGEVWQVMDVPNRSGILFHSGNLSKHTLGCILVAEHFGKLQGDFAVLNSGSTYKEFMYLTRSYIRMSLVITECY